MKKDNIKKLLELERLVEQGIENERTRELRLELGMNVQEKEMDFSQLEKQFFRLRALQLTEQEIAFALGIGPVKISKMKQGFTNEELDERIEYYEKHRIVLNHMKQREKRLESSLHWRLRKLGKRAYDND